MGGYFLGAIDLDALYTVMDVIEHTPHYIVSGLYLLLTLAIEYPVVYYSLWRDTDKETYLAASAVVSNIITTVLVSICEGIFAPGAW